MQIYPPDILLLFGAASRSTPQLQKTSFRMKETYCD